MPSQSASNKHNQEKVPQTFATIVNYSKNVSVMFDNHTNSLLRIYNEQTLRMFSLRDLHFLICSFHLFISSVHFISKYYVRKGSYTCFYLNYPQINEIGKSSCMASRGVPRHFLILSLHGSDCILSVHRRNRLVQNDL